MATGKNPNKHKCQLCKHEFARHIVDSNLAATRKVPLLTFKCEVCGCTQWTDKDRDGVPKLMLEANLTTALVSCHIWHAVKGKGVEKFVNGYAKVHPKEKCQGERERQCVIHNPTDHEMRDWPAIMDGPKDHFFVWRLCTHWVVHPDPDALWFAEEVMDRFGLGVHDCDSCCGV